MFLANGETFEVLRRAQQDRSGDGSFTDYARVYNCGFAWESTTETNNRQEISVVFGTIFIPKDPALWKFTDSGGVADVVATDKLRREQTGEIFKVVGTAQWDGVHPMTGTDHGYKLFRVKGVF